MAYSADRAFELISSAHDRGRLAHAFLISGAHGSGKENLAARMIQLVSGAPKSGGFDLFGEPVVVETPPLDELESGWIRVIRPRMKSRRIGVEEIRDLEQTLHLAAPGGACKVGVITEADRMNDQAANAFLQDPRRTAAEHAAAASNRQSAAAAADDPLALRAPAAVRRAGVAGRWRRGTGLRAQCRRLPWLRHAGRRAAFESHLRLVPRRIHARRRTPPPRPPRRRKSPPTRYAPTAPGSRSARISTRPPPRRNTSMPATGCSTC